jgi:hypothetical protein
MENVTNHFVKFIFPFTFVTDLNSKKNSFECIIKELDGFMVKMKNLKDGKMESFKAWQQIPPEEISDFYLPHIGSFLSDDMINNYLVRRVMNPGLMKGLFCLYEQKVPFIITGKAPKTKFNIEEVSLYLFQSGIGYLIMEVKTENASPFELADLNYALHYFEHQSAEIGFSEFVLHEKAMPGFQTKVSAGTQTEPALPIIFMQLKQFEISGNTVLPSGQIDFGKIFTGILDFAVFPPNAYKPLLNKNFLVFTYLCLNDEEGKDHSQIIFQLRKVIKDSYLPHQDDLSGKNGGVINTYKNIIFGVSLEGAVIFVEDNGHPFFRQFIENVRKGYFLIYLLALHNRLALLNFGIELGNAIPNRGISLDREFSSGIHKIRNKTISFYMNAYFGQLTNNTVYERVYTFYHENFHTGSLMEEIKKKTWELDEMISNDLEMKSNQLLRNLTILGFIVAPVSVVLAFFGTNIDYNGSQLLFSIYIILIFSVSILLLFAGITWWIKKKQ